MAGRHQASKENTLNGLLLHAKSYVEDLQSSILVIRLNKNSTKVNVSGDSMSVNSLKKNSKILKNIKDILEMGEEEVELKYIDDEQENLKKVSLPKLKYRLVSEMKEMLSDSSNLWKLLQQWWNVKGLGETPPCGMEREILPFGGIKNWFYGIRI